MLEPRNQNRKSRQRSLAAKERQPRPSQTPPRQPDGWTNASPSHQSPPSQPSSSNSSPYPPDLRPRSPEGYLAPSDRSDARLQKPRSPRRGATQKEGSFNLKNLLSGGSGRTNASAQPRRGTAPPASWGIRPMPNSSRDLQPPPGRTSRGMARAGGNPAVVPINRYQSNPLSNPEPTVIPYPERDGQRRRPASLLNPSGRPRSRQASGRLRRLSPLVYAMRLLILGVGLGAIAGTLLSILNPAVHQSNASQAAITDSASPQAGADASNAAAAALSSASQPSGQEITALKSTIQALASQSPDLTLGVYVVDLDTNAFVNVGGNTSFPAASTIKVPVLVAFLQDVDAGKIRLDEPLTMEASDVTDGSGDMQYQPVGTQYTALETAQMMITISDNTATNMVIRRLGGIAAVNQRFREWGMATTVIRNPLADLAGTNTTSPKELTDLLTRVSQGDLLSLRSRDRLFEIMQGTVTDTLIPTGIGDSLSIVAHKTGTIDNMVGDTGVVDMPSGKRYVVTALVQRPMDDDRAQELIRQACRAIHDYFRMPPTAAPAAGNAAASEAAASPVPQSPESF